MEQKETSIIDLPSPDLLWINKADRLAWRLNKLEPGDNIALNIQNKDWIEPIDMVLLALCTLIIHEKTQNQVVIKGLLPHVERYLATMGFHDLVKDACSNLQLRQPMFNFFTTNKSVSITKLNALEDILPFVNNVKSVLDRAFPNRRMQNYKDKVSTVVLEACSNGVEHSTRPTYGVVQVYSHKGENEVRIAIGDTGMGIKRHLQNRHGNIGFSDNQYIMKALEGTSGRLGARGGNGLRRIQEICRENGGSFSIRSGQGALAILPELFEHQGFNEFPGTQLSIVLHPNP